MYFHKASLRANGGDHQKNLHYKVLLKKIGALPQYRPTLINLGQVLPSMHLWLNPFLFMFNEISCPRVPVMKFKESRMKDLFIRC